MCVFLCANIRDSANELLGIFHDPANTVDSPDFGPPPVAHFEGDGDPIKYDAALNDHEEAIAMKPFTNLETRKKRRESSIGREFARLETLDSIEACTMPVTLENTMGTQPAKLGAKRKLDARDDEDRVVPSAINEKDFFQFNRRSDALDGTGEEIARGALPTGNTIAGNKSSQDRSGVRPLSREKILEGMSLSNTRKALGESKRHRTIFISLATANRNTRSCKHRPSSLSHQNYKSLYG